MAACSVPTGTSISVAAPATVSVGTPFVVTESFATDGSGVSCPQVLGFAVRIDGGASSTWATEDPVTEGVDYAKTYTPARPGSFAFFAQLVWRDEEGGFPFHVLAGTDTVTIRVVPAMIAEVETDQMTVGTMSEFATVDLSRDTAALGVASDAITVELASDNITLGAGHET